MDLNLLEISKKYRPAPFWSWNDRLDPAELRRQIREMHQAGLGGFFMHARGGLQTAYLSKEWMACVEASLDEAAKYGMQAWLYDENGWPSGFGGGLVNGLGIDYQQKYLRHEYVDAATAAARENTIAFYAPDTLQLLGTTLPDGTTGRVLRCYFTVNRYYVDNLDRKVVAEFLRVTHQHYYETLPAGVLQNLRGIFTDEPQLSRDGLLWSFVLEQEYRKAYGRELLPELPQLFINTSESGAMRIRFWRLCAQLFTVNFMKQIRDWCDAHNWEITGHHACEESFQDSINCNGSVMAQYRYYHVPGIDHLCRRPASAVAAVQMVSSAAQFGQKQTMTESFALTGWACHFSGMRWIYLPQMAHGINFLCPHLEGYSLRGLRKRDYPASAFYHQPWWGDYAAFNDSVSRVGMILAEGTAETDVLVVHPLSSAWKVYTGDGKQPLLASYTQSLEAMTRALDTWQVGHHYADEIIVDEFGSVEDKMFRIGRVCYRTVIVPQLSNLSSRMAALLQEFERSGGKILVVRNQKEDGPLTIDGETADRKFLAWFDRLPAFNSEFSAAEAAANLEKRCVRVTENGISAGSIISTSRQVTLNRRAGHFFYLVNTSYHQPARVKISLPAAVDEEEVDVMDPVTGKLTRLTGITQKERKFKFDFDFAPASDACFFVAEKSSLPEYRPLPDLTGKNVLTLKDEFTLPRSISNILTIDRCRYRIDQGEWQSCDIIDLQARLLARQCDCDLDMEMEFFCDADFDAAKPLQLAVETPERFRFALNGQPFDATVNGYLFDKAFQLLALPPCIRTGRNVLAMSIRYTQPVEVYQAIEAAKKFESEYNKLTFETELESVYLYGDFSVRHHGAVEKLDRNAIRCLGTFSLGAPISGTTVSGVDLLAAGLPFFCGKLTLQQTFELSAEEAQEASFLHLALNGINSCRVKINDHDAGSCHWEPFVWEIGPYLKTGKNEIRLELTTSLRNMLGPHHLAEGECYGVSTLSFNREPNVIGSKPPPYDPGFCLVNFGVSGK